MACLRSPPETVPQAICSTASILIRSLSRRLFCNHAHVDEASAKTQDPNGHGKCTSASARSGDARPRASSCRPFSPTGLPAWRCSRTAEDLMRAEQMYHGINSESRAVAAKPQIHRAFVVAILFTFSLVALQTCAQRDEAPEIKIAPKTNVFFAFGDMRFTDSSRANVSDAKARRALVERMAGTLEKPDFVIITGDIVYDGDDKKDWDTFVNETKSFRDQHIRLLPVLGNHDVQGPSGQKNFFEHFEELKIYPQLKKQGWYSVDYGNSRFVMLDSQTTYAPETPQGEWLRSQLKRTPEDLDFLIIVLHHPLITHPVRVQTHPVAFPHDVEDAEVRLKLLLEAFSQSHRGTKVLVISGHNHNYEHYLDKDITYIVTAGGGATPYKIRRQPKDFYPKEGTTYHYCKLMIQGHTLKGEMLKLNWSGSSPEWESNDVFEITAQTALVRPPVR
jgi:acid phosphatase type 7